jgi:hypothetical protein
VPDVKKKSMFEHLLHITEVTDAIDIAAMYLDHEHVIEEPARYVHRIEDMDPFAVQKQIAEYLLEYDKHKHHRFAYDLRFKSAEEYSVAGYEIKIFRLPTEKEREAARVTAAKRAEKRAKLDEAAAIKGKAKRKAQYLKLKKEFETNG